MVLERLKPLFILKSMPAYNDIVNVRNNQACKAVWKSEM